MVYKSTQQQRYYGNNRGFCSKWQGLLSSYNLFRFSSVVVGISGRLIVSLYTCFTSVRSASAACDYNKLAQTMCTARGMRKVYLLQNSALCSLSCSSFYFVSLQCPEPSCSMAALASMTHNRTRRWTSGWLIRECTVYQPQDQSPRRLIGTTHKANWCQVTTGMRWIKLLLVVELQHSPSKATNNAKVESTSAEWLVNMESLLVHIGECKYYVRCNL